MRDRVLGSLKALIGPHGIGREEVVLSCGLGSIWGGCAMAGLTYVGFWIVGFVLVWIGLPVRRRFVESVPPAAPKGTR